MVVPVRQDVTDRPAQVEEAASGKDQLQGRLLRKQVSLPPRRVPICKQTYLYNTSTIRRTKNKITKLMEKTKHNHELFFLIPQTNSMLTM